MFAVGRSVSVVALVCVMSACARAEPKAPSAPVAATISKTDDSTFCLADEHSSLEKHGEADPLPALDRRFLKAHTRARAEECRRLESERLVIRFSFGQLEARWHGEPLLGGKVDVLPSEYHAVKNASHAVFLAGLLFDDHSKEAPVHVADAVASLDDAIRHLHDGSSESAKRIPASLLPAQERLLVETRTAIAAFGKGELDAAAQKAFFAKVRPDVLANLRTVSGALVRGLDATVKRVRAAVEEKDPKAWDGLVVLVTVSHQARAREIGVQYFERLLGEQAGEGARNERRLIVSEGLGKAPQQYGLLVAHIVDQVGSQRVFDDPLRLQWDVLADDGGALDELFRR